MVNGEPPPGTTDVITGTTAIYVNVWEGDDCASSPLSVLVTTTGPLVPLHGLASPVVRARTSVPLTLITWARMPAILTVSGSLNPVPSIRTCVPPIAVPITG